MECAPPTPPPPGLSFARSEPCQSRASFYQYVVDPAYGWAEVCEERFGTHPIQILHEGNTAAMSKNPNPGPRNGPSPSMSCRQRAAGEVWAAVGKNTCAHRRNVTVPPIQPTAFRSRISHS
jgi:hypothetical protein